MRGCYEIMLQFLGESGEENCVENVAIGSSTTTVFLKALQKYCMYEINVISNSFTYEGRSLYEVVINSTKWGNTSKTVVVLDAGQDAGEDTVRFALYLIEQLVACTEYSELIDNIRWVILPSTNPDGLEYMRVKQEVWKKNLKLTEEMSYGVDITRNFDDNWSSCPTNDNIFSQDYPGPSPVSENETRFITDVLNKYKNDLKAYVSFRRDGHSILYAFASVSNSNAAIDKAKEIAGDIAARVNQKGGSVQWFVNQSIYNMNGKTHCGHSVDYAVNKLNVPYAFEMRLFVESDNMIISKFQNLPKGYESSLRLAYFNGIKQLYKSIAEEKEINPVF